MAVSRDLVEGLTLLSDALDGPVADLNGILEGLNGDLVAAVPGYLGLTVAVQVGEHPIVVNTLDIEEASAVAATLMLPLAPLSRAAATGSVVFYSRTARAFIQVADDARWIFNLDGPAVLDGHLPAMTGPVGPRGVRGLTALCAVNQAVGALIVGGFTVQGAHAELRRRATRSGDSVPEAARRLLGDIDDPTGGTDGT